MKEVKFEDRGEFKKKGSELGGAGAASGRTNFLHTEKNFCAFEVRRRATPNLRENSKKKNQTNLRYRWKRK